MAKAFYERLLAKAELGKALQDARQAVFAEQIETTWGAYQLYGNPGDTLLRRRNGGNHA
jgi:hypothetical protein